MAVIPEDAAALLRRGDVLAYVATINPDGSPHVTPTWVDVDTERGLVLVNSAEGRRKVLNLRRDPRVMLAAHAPERPVPALLIRGAVTGFVHEGVLEHIDGLSRRYDGKRWDPRPGQQRVLLEITPERVDFTD